MQFSLRVGAAHTRSARSRRSYLPSSSSYFLCTAPHSNTWRHKNIGRSVASWNHHLISSMQCACGSGQEATVVMLAKNMVLVSPFRDKLDSCVLDNNTRALEDMSCFSWVHVHHIPALGGILPIRETLKWFRGFENGSRAWIQWWGVIGWIIVFGWFILFRRSFGFKTLNF